MSTPPALPPPLEHQVLEFEQGQRLDRLLASLAGLGRAGARRLLEADAVRLNGRRAPKGVILRAGDLVRVQLPAGDGAAQPNPELPLQVVHEEPELLVVDKPAGMHCHPLIASDTRTLASALLARYPELARVGTSPLEPGLVHRIDRDTSGLLLVARSPAAFAWFSAILRADRADEKAKDGVIRKRYTALCAGRDVALGRREAYLRATGPRVRVAAEAFQDGRPIESELTAARPVGPFSLVEVSVPSAARHQVRAHLAFLGHPIVGDVLYGGPALEGLTRHFLHASHLALQSPASGELLELDSPLPPELSAALARAERTDDPTSAG